MTEMNVKNIRDPVVRKPLGQMILNDYLTIILRLFLKDQKEGNNRNMENHSYQIKPQ